ncbi:MAG: radical SAM protein [Candidatus Omnitrophica bacterium]|nr:radical SAM protein [Candidatus Omnitrophota bacterium]
MKPTAIFKSMDLSITNRCNASCIYCPAPGIKDKKRYIKPREVRKIIDDLLRPSFFSRYGLLSTVEIGGLYEPLLHPDVIDILREFRHSYPVAKVMLYTNGLLLNSGISSAIVKEGLASALVVNIDGLDADDYTPVKGIPYGVVSGNLRRFISLRDKARSPCRILIRIMSYKKYCEAVNRALKRPPLALNSVDGTVRDNTAAVIRKWKPLLSAADQIKDASDEFQLRGEYEKDRGVPDVDEYALKCPWLNYVIHSINITSDGKWIICCNDFFKEGVLGDVFRSSLEDIADTKRNEFIRCLLSGKTKGLPVRCRRRQYCQFLG